MLADVCIVGKYANAGVHTWEGTRRFKCVVPPMLCCVLVCEQETIGRRSAGLRPQVQERVREAT